ncbi:hypothetical protein [Catenulispora rubra]|uniref:hypothetical protein n=1 Tax=Catenulispora rubra TaxID=280293 RepID=UPI0018922B82|nr:hypothetical protein [Catenulispora rubra]
MTDLRRTLLIAGGCAAAAGAIGLVALRLLRGRSLYAKLITALAPIALSTTAGSLCTVRTGFLSGQVAVCIAAALALPAMAVLLTQRVTADLRILRAAIRTIGEQARSEHPHQPVRLATAELDDLSCELVATEARLSRSREQERAEERSRRELLTKASLELHTPLANLHALTVALEDDTATELDACYTQTLTAVDQLTRMVDDLFTLCREPSGHQDPGRPE